MNHDVAESGARRWALALMLGLVALIGCSSGGSDVLAPPAELHYDGDHADSPSLAGATYEAAARFTSALTGPLAGDALTEVEFYIANVPLNCKVKVYGANSATAPGAPLYSATVTAGLTANSWNSHVLTSLVSVPNGDLWIAIEFTHAAPLQTIGCDPGPAVQDGDWLYASTDGSWIPFSQRPFGANINWNIRGIVTAVP